MSIVFGVLGSLLVLGIIIGSVTCVCMFCPRRIGKDGEEIGLETVGQEIEIETVLT